MLRTLLFALLAAPCTAFQAPALSVRSALAASRVVTPAMGPFDFLAFGQAGARHILLSDRGKANFLKQQIEEGKMSFAAAAQEYSTCPSASKGGDVSAASSAPCSLMACLQAFPHQRCASAWCVCFVCVCMCVCVCVCARACAVCVRAREPGHNSWGPSSLDRWLGLSTTIALTRTRSSTNLRLCALRLAFTSSSSPRSPERGCIPWWRSAGPRTNWDRALKRESCWLALEIVAKRALKPAQFTRLVRPLALAPAPVLFSSVLDNDIRTFGPDPTPHTPLARIRKSYHVNALYS
jgi:hypothetical protein